MKRIKDMKALKATKKFFGHPVPCIFLVLVGWFALQLFTQVCLIIPGMLLGDAATSFAAVADIVVMVLYVRWIKKRLGSDFVIGFRFDNLGKGLAMCAVVCVPMIIDNLLESAKIVGATPMNLSAAEFVRAFVDQVFYGLRPGITEECLCRVMLMGIIMHLTKGKKHRLGMAVGLSSCIFGVLHLINILNGAPVAITLYQVLYASAIGVMFAAVYARTRNIIATMIFHSLVDITSKCYVNFYPELVAVGEELAQTPSRGDAVVYLTVTVLCVAFGLYLLRPSKHHEIEEHWGSLAAAEEVSAV